MSVPTAQDLSNTNLTPQSFAELQGILAAIDPTKITDGILSGSGNFGLTAPGTASLPFNEFDYMVPAPLSNKGNPTSTLRQSSNDFFVGPGQAVRLVDNSTGNVIFEGNGPEDARKASELAAGLTEKGGKKANWDIQVGPNTLAAMSGADVRPEGSWMTVAEENVNKSVIGQIADVALPVIGTILAGPLGAAAGSAASSVAQGRDIGDVLLRAAIAGGTSALVPGGSAPTETATQTVGQIAGQATGQAAGQAVSQAAAQAVDDIIVNAILPSLGSQVLGGAAGGIASSIIPSFFDSAQLSDAIPTQPAQSQPAPAPTPSVSDIVVTAPVAAAPALPAAVAPAIASGVLGSIASPPVQQPVQTQQPSQPTQSEEIVVTAPSSNFTLPAVAAATGAGLLTGIAPTTPPATAPTTQQGPIDTPVEKSLLDRLTDNMSLTDYLTLASLLGSGVSGLFGGGSAAPAPTPYTSLLGPAPTLGGSPAAARQMNAPYAGDYERYGFGPEYQFFKPA